MTKFDGGDSYCYTALATHEDSDGLVFCSGCHDLLDGVAHDVDRCIGHGFFNCGWVLDEDVPSGGSTAGFGQDKVCRV